MSLSTLTAAFGDFDEWESEFRPAERTQPIGDEPLPPADERLRRREHRPARRASERAAIEQSMRGEA